jgi:multidrug efflux system membrane fusion protein
MSLLHILRNTIAGALTLLPFSVVAQDTTVYTEVVKQQAFVQPIHTSGVLVNPSEQTLAFKTPGLVARVLVREGQSLRKGQVLAELDKSEIDAEVAQARALLKEAQRAEERLHKLFKTSVVPLDQLQSAQTSVEVIASRLKIAEFNQRHATIEAPSNGVVLKKQIEPNEIVNAQRPAFIFAEEGKGWLIRVGLNDRDVVRVREGDSADIVLDAYPGQTIAASVSEVAAKASDGTGTFEIEVRLQPQKHRIFSGMVGRVTIEPRSLCAGCTTAGDITTGADTKLRFPQGGCARGSDGR